MFFEFKYMEEGEADKEEWKRNPKSRLLKRYVFPWLLVKGQSQSECLQEAKYIKKLMIFSSLFFGFLFRIVLVLLRQSKKGTLGSLRFLVASFLSFSRSLFDYRKIDVMKQVRPTTDTS